MALHYGESLYTIGVVSRVINLHRSRISSWHFSYLKHVYNTCPFAYNVGVFKHFDDFFFLTFKSLEHKKHVIVTILFVTVTVTYDYIFTSKKLFVKDASKI